MITVFDNFIQDEKLLAEIEQNKELIFKDPGVYKYYEGWWKSPENTTTKKDNRILMGRCMSNL